MENEEIIKRYCGNTIMAVELEGQQLIVYFAGETGFAITNTVGSMATDDALHELVGQTLEAVQVTPYASGLRLPYAWGLRLTLVADGAETVIYNYRADWYDSFDLLVSEVR